MLFCISKFSLVIKYTFRIKEVKKKEILTEQNLHPATQVPPYWVSIDLPFLIT